MAEYNVAVLERSIEFDQLAKCMLKDADIIIVQKTRWPEDVNDTTKNRSVKVSLLNIDYELHGLMVHHFKDRKASDVYGIEPAVAEKHITQQLYYSLADESINIRMTDRTDGYETAEKLATDFMNAKVTVKDGGFNHRIRLDTQIGEVIMHQSFFTPMHVARHTICVGNNLHPLDVARKWYDQVTYGWMKRRIPNVKVSTQEYAHGIFPSVQQLSAGTMSLAEYSYSSSYKRMKASWTIYADKDVMNTAWRLTTVYGPEVQMLGSTTMYTTKDLHEGDKAIADVNSFSLSWTTMATQAPYYKRFQKQLTHDESCRVRVLLRVNELRAIELYYILFSRLLPPWAREKTGVQAEDIVEGKETFQLSNANFEDIHPLEIISRLLNRRDELLPDFVIPRKGADPSRWIRTYFPYLEYLRQIAHRPTYVGVDTITLMEITTLNNIMLLLFTLIPGANIEKANRLDVAVFETRSDLDQINKIQAHEKYQWDYASPEHTHNFQRKITISMAISQFSAAYSTYVGLTLHQIADLQRVGLPDAEYHNSYDKYEALEDGRDKAWTDEKAEIDKMTDGPAKTHAQAVYKKEKEQADHRLFFVKSARMVSKTVDRCWAFNVKSLDFVTYNQISGVVSYHCRGFTDVITSSIPLRAPRRSHIPILIGPGYLKLHDVPHILQHRFPLTYGSTTGAVGLLIDHEDHVAVWKEGNVSVKTRDLLVGKVKGKLVTISIEGGVFGSNFYGVKLGSVS
ncbi:VP3 protein [Acado virus]|nr:VP3 protein [Acado virus]